MDQNFCAWRGERSFTEIKFPVDLCIRRESGVDAGGVQKVYFLNSLRKESEPQVHGEGWIKGFEARNRVNFEDPN